MNPSHESDHQPNNQPDHKTKTELINWRRNKIIELKAQGHNQEEIAQILQVSPALISSDFQVMRKEAMENVKDYTVRELPLQFKATIIAAQKAIKEYWKISQNAHDNRERIQALDSYVKCHLGLCRYLYEGGAQLEQFLADHGIDNGNGFPTSIANNDPDYKWSHDENGRHYAEGESVHPKGYGSYTYTSSPSHLMQCSEKHDITEQQIEKMKTRYYGVTDEDIEQIKARWWCYNSGKSKETIST